MRKRKYPQKLRSQLREWQEKIDQLRQRMKQAGEESRRELEHQIEDLQAKQKAARRKLDQLEKFAEDARSNPGARVRRAGQKINHTVKRIVSGLR